MKLLPIPIYNQNLLEIGLNLKLRTYSQKGKIKTFYFIY